jgi:hypothetical protein
VTVRNRQRSRAFQSASAAGLGLTAPLAAFVSTGGLPAWSWLLWATLTVQGVASILVVHARLKRRVAARSTSGPPETGSALALQSFQVPVAAALVTLHWPLAFPALFSFIASLLEIRRIYSDSGAREPLTRVGRRTLAYAILHMAVTIAALWPLARPRV